MSRCVRSRRAISPSVLNVRRPDASHVERGTELELVALELEA